jgi:hypothetical protein
MSTRSARTPHLARLLSAVIVATLLAVLFTRREAVHAAEPSAASADWTASLTGTHRQLFDAPMPNGGIPLVHVMNYYDSYNRAYHVPDSSVSGILTFYGMTVFHGLTDDMWQKYRLGEFTGEKNAAGAPAVTNPWRTAPVVLGGPLPRAGIDSLQARGATFLLCNNALELFSSMVARSRHLDAQDVYEDMKEHILPGVRLVPAMVIAIEQAHQAGISYHRQ